MAEPDEQNPPPASGNWGPTVFRAGAISNWIVTIGAILLPAFAAEWFLDITDMNYYFLLRIWSGMAFLWGIFFWVIARDLHRYSGIIWFSWAEKLITTVAVSIATATGELASLNTFILIVFTDIVWIPLFLWFDLRTRGNPGAARALAHARRTLGLEPAE